MPNTTTVACACCEKDFIARIADRNRGWARFCSKSCKAKYQTQLQNKTGENKTKGKLKWL